MDHNLYHKEAEFRKMNIELELKTQALIEEVDTVIRNQEQKNTNRPKTTTIVRPDTALLSESNFSNNDENVPSENNGRNNTLHNIAKFLKMKMLKMQEEVKRLQIEYKKKSDSVKKLQVENKNLEDERTKLMQQLQISNEAVTKNDDQIAMLTQRLQLKETENHCLRKEIDTLKKDLRSQGSISSSSEIRLNRALEEIERLKYHIKENKMELKEARESNGKEMQELRMKNKRLENQKADLSSAVKKQTLLIDNLKRQKLHLEASKVLNITEEEFLKILDWTLASKSDSPKTIVKTSHHKLNDNKIEEIHS